MNHDSFPNSEQALSQQDYESLTGCKTFEDHIKTLEDNGRALTKPSLKNEVLKEGYQYTSPTVENLSKKIKNSESLTIEDVISLTDEKGFAHYKKEIAEYLSNMNLEDGKDFDIKLPGKATESDGSQIELPLSISFFNGEDFTRIDFFANPQSRDGGVTIESRKGDGKEGIDVGYTGPVSRDYRPRDFHSIDLE